MIKEFSLQKPLEGVKVIELSTMITASLATMMLADQGAEVIKVEAITGDPLRLLGTSSNGISAMFNNCNRGKKSVAVDLKDNAAQAAVRTLMKDADVVIHNFRPGVMDRLGLGSEQLRTDNPSLIFVEINGFGKDGPLANAPAYDSVIQALSGLTAVQSDGGRPGFMKTLLCDKVTAYTAWQAITAALYVRERSEDQQGQHIDISMLHAMLAFMWPDCMANETFLDDGIPKSPNIADVFWVTTVQDGHISIMAATDDQWAGVFRILGKPELIDDPRYADLYGRVKHIGELREIMNAGFAKFTLKELLARLKDEDVPGTECLDREKAITHPQVTALELVEEHACSVMGNLRAVAPPISFEGKRGLSGLPAPKLGLHTRECLMTAGLSEDQIKAFEAEKRIFVAS
ncbi:CaiB/BaiF CoA transferase family protein [Kordiimonas laminariae]|uniref:CaiB/BaiF CoA transferase family protein n=1 Tax=Kordiimonas laminariae TaxID=2917717 RepID=UPI001FF2D874|nr:CoA transferase [Kordiimonas laminariae]MCK0071192.1 CoA transferase [Kordiimonas laminariae]